MLWWRVTNLERLVIKLWHFEYSTKFDYIQNNVNEMGPIPVYRLTRTKTIKVEMNLINPTMHLPHSTQHCTSDQKCAQFCSEWCIGGFGTSVFWDSWGCSILSTFPLFVGHRQNAPLYTIDTRTSITCSARHSSISQMINEVLICCELKKLIVLLFSYWNTTYSHDFPL